MPSEMWFGNDSAAGDWRPSRNSGGGLPPWLIVAVVLALIVVAVVVFR